MSIFDVMLVRFRDFMAAFLTVGLWKLALCAVVIVLALLIKSAVSKCVFKVIKKKSKNENGVVVTVLDIIDRPIQLLVITAAIYVCLGILSITGTFSGIVTQTISTLILAAVFMALANAADHIEELLGKVTDKTNTHMDNIAAKYISAIAKLAVFILGVLCILQVWVDDITGLIAGLSIGGVAIALAAQDIAANLFGSITVMLDRPFDIGEYIEVDGVAGTVESMGMRSTRIRTLDHALIIVPNKTMSTAKITNWTKIDRRRVIFNIGVTYSTTKAQLEELISRIEAMLNARDDIRKEGIFVGFAEFGDSALLISVRFYTLTGDVGDAAVMRQKVNFAIMDIVNEMRLSFAFPSQSVYIESMPKT